MDQIPDCILVLIFSKVAFFRVPGVLTRVCKRWNNIINTHHMYWQLRREDVYRILYVKLTGMTPEDTKWAWDGDVDKKEEIPEENKHSKVPYSFELPHYFHKIGNLFERVGIVLNLANSKWLEEMSRGMCKISGPSDVAVFDNMDSIKSSAYYRAFKTSEAKRRRGELAGQPQPVRVQLNHFGWKNIDGWGHEASLYRA